MYVVQAPLAADFWYSASPPEPPLLVALLLSPSAFALDYTEASLIRQRLYTTTDLCGVVRQYAVNDVGLTCLPITLDLPDAICYSRLLVLCTYPDVDGDGYAWNVDCNDADPAISPVAAEIACDGVDQNCDDADPRCDPDQALLDTDADATLSGFAFHSQSFVDSAGDMNGDGYGDVFVGSSWSTMGATGSGGAYVFYGPMSGSLSASSAADIVLAGTGTNSYLGDSVAGGQDLDGDGYDDLAAGGSLVTTASYQDGGAFVFYGPLSGEVSQGAADVVVASTSSILDVAGAMSMIPDATGDGTPDLLMSATGGAYLLSGPNLQGGSLAAAAGTFNVSYFEWISGVGDLNGDGMEDIGVGCGGCDATAGWVYVMFGPINGAHGTAEADVFYDGVGGYFGGGFAGANDLNGDGLDDLAVGAWGLNTLYYSAGAVYVFDGGDTGTVGQTTGSEAVLYGEGITSYAGGLGSVNGLRDVDGDGFDELLVGARGDDEFSENSGAAYVLHGPVSGAWNLGQSDTGIYSTAGGAFFAMSLDEVGDTDADGVDDLLVGAYNGGKAFLYSGAGL